MIVLFHLGHPAHFHLFKNVIKKLNADNVSIHILIKKKDVLEKLLIESGLFYVNILPEGKSDGKIGLIRDLVKRGREIYKYCKKHQPDILVGTSPDISYIGRLLGIPTINVNEDDANIVPLYSWMAYPLADVILSPDCCDNGRWNNKTIKYPGYHELAYLHPDLFKPDKEIVSQYVNLNEPYFILRFSSLKAHHDVGIGGINNVLVRKLIDILSSQGRILITSEKDLDTDLKKYLLKINPTEIHHFLAFAKFVIGDSQTMSAESAVLGTPYIRFNDFVGKIGYLKELEEKYELGYGFKTDQTDMMLAHVEKLSSWKGNELYQTRKMNMLKDKINVADFIFDQIMEVLNKVRIKRNVN